MRGDVRPGFRGLRVLALESRRADDMRRLIETHGGVATVAPSMTEVPRGSNIDALRFAADLAAHAFGAVIFLTGVGARALAAAIEPALPRDRFASALNQVTVIARGPKPTAALRQLGVTSIVSVPAPHTWREVLQQCDSLTGDRSIRGRRVAVQEYGTSNEPLLTSLRQRGADVTPVGVYDWALPADTGPLRAAVAAAARGEFDVILFTTSAQVRHLVQIATELGIETAIRRACATALIGSIGPTTSEELFGHGLSADFEPSRSNMALLVMEAARHGADMLERKRRRLA